MEKIINNNFITIFNMANTLLYSNEYLEELPENIFSGKEILDALKYINANDVILDSYKFNRPEYLLSKYFWNSKQPLLESNKYQISITSKNYIIFKRIQLKDLEESMLDIKNELLSGKLFNKKYYGKVEFTGQEIKEGLKFILNRNDNCREYYIADRLMSEYIGNSKAPLNPNSLYVIKEHRNKKIYIARVIKSEGY